MRDLLQQLQTPENIIFIGTMVFLFFYSIIKISRNPKESSTLPNLIAAFGIIGTFYGIFIGLLYFDTKDINGSIPKLLEGMKTAFVTSLIGLSLSNILKTYQSFKVKKLIKKQGRDQSEVSLEKISEIMLDMKESIIDSNQKLVNTIIEMNENDKRLSEKNEQNMLFLINSLTGEEENTLVSQMKLLRNDMTKAQLEAQERLNTGLEKMSLQLSNLVESNNSISTEIEKGNSVLIEEFRIFAKNMAENNMKAFTEAIQKCIKDLNNQLQEQFGENFKHLNLAVEKLLEWQIHYKETIEKTNITQEELYKGMEKARELVVEINERSLSIVEIANKLGDKIITFDTQQQALNNSIEILNKISLEAKELTPNIDKYISKFNDKIILTTEKIGTISTDVKTQILNSTQNIENYMNDVDSKLLEHTTIATDRITNHIVETTNKGIDEINKSSLNVLEKVNLVNQEAIKNISRLSDYFEKESSKSIKHIDTIQNTIKNSINSLLDNISTVSNVAEKSIIDNNKQIEMVRNQIKDLTQASTENIKQQQNIIVDSLKNLAQAIETNSNLNLETIEKQISSIDKAVTKLENEGFTLTKRIADNIQNMVDNNNSNLNTSIENINQLLNATLNTSLQSLGEQLATVSEKFVSDYTPLTLELQKVVNIAKKVG